MAASWLSVLMSDGIDLWDIVPGLCPELNDPMTKMLLNEDIDGEEVRKAALDILETASGRKWWITMRLISAVRNSWEVVGGELALQGVRANEVPLGAWLDAAFLVCIRGLEPDKVTMFTSQLEVPPIDISVEANEMVMSPSEFAAIGAM